MQQHYHIRTARRQATGIDVTSVTVARSNGLPMARVAFNGWRPLDTEPDTYVAHTDPLRLPRRVRRALLEIGVDPSQAGTVMT